MMTSAKANATDLFEAVRWLDDLWNSRARAAGPNMIEWECRTWGSGRGAGTWEETVMFSIIAQRFGLATCRNMDERDETIVQVPLDQFDAVAGLIGRLGDEPESWPWCAEDLEDDEQRQIALAAEVLDLAPKELEDDWELLELLKIE